MEGPPRKPTTLLLDRMPSGIPPDILPSYEAYGCRVNAISVEELFRRYEQAGFLYPAKLEKLAPFLSTVRENWRQGLRGGELLLYCVVATGDDDPDAWASLACWRSTNNGWQSQHLVSVGNPIASRAVMLSTQAIRSHDWRDHSYQNWFRPENRFPARVFGTLVDTIGPEHSAVGTYHLLAAPLSLKAPAARVAVAEDRRNGRLSGLHALATEARSCVYAEAEELGLDDLGLDAVDQLYARVGLRRYRRVWLAHLPGRDLPVGAALAYRGPLGFNFSFLENRCDLLLAPTLNEAEVREVTLSLAAAAAPAYADFLPGAIPLVACARARPVLEAAGARFVRCYCQSIWLRESFIGWYRHVEKFYQRIIRAEHRRGLGGRRAGAIEKANHRGGIS